MGKLWQSSRGKQALIPLDTEAKSMLRGRVPSVEGAKNDNYDEVVEIQDYLQELQYSKVWNYRVGVDFYNSLWKNPDGKIIFMQWWRRTGAVEIFKPFESDDLDELFAEIKNYTQANLGEE